MPQKSYHKKLSDTQLSGAMAERVQPNGKRALKLRQDEKKELLRQQKVETAVALFLDLQQDHNWQEIADACGLSVLGLKDLTKTEEFIKVYNEHFAELGHDPRLKATQAALTDLLSPAIRAIRDVLTSPLSPASARMKAAFEIIKLNGLEAVDPKNSDKSELQEFLKGSGINIEQLNVTLPPEYLEKGVQDILEGQVRDILDEPRLLQAPETISDQKTDQTE